MKATTTDQVIKVIERINTERTLAERQGLADDVAVLDEELYDLRLALLKLRWKEQTR